MRFVNQSRGEMSVGTSPSRPAALQLPAEHDGVRLHEVVPEKPLEGKAVGTVFLRRIDGVGAGAILEMHRHRMEADRAPRMRIEPVYLLLELQRIRPVVVAFAHRDVFAADERPEEPGGDSDALRPLVLLLEDSADNVRTPFGILADYLGRSVRRGIVVDKHLKGEVGLLHQEAIKRLADVRGRVVGDAGHGKAWRRRAAGGWNLSAHVIRPPALLERPLACPTRTNA